MIVGEVVTLACLCLAVSATSFNKSYRIPAGAAISKQELEKDGVAKLTYMFISFDIDYEYCDGHPPFHHHIDNVYLTQLNSQLQGCVSSDDCEPIVWMAADLLEVKCLETDESSYATAIDLRCGYEVEHSTKHLMSVDLLTMVVEDVKKTCTNGQEAIVTELFTVGAGRSLLNCSSDAVRQSEKFISNFINNCNDPCESFTLSPTVDYGCTNVLGYQHSNNLTSAPLVGTIIAFYRCIQNQDVTPIKTTETVKVVEHSKWMPVGVIFILLFCIIAGAVVAMFVYYWKFKRNAKGDDDKFGALEANNNNRSAVNRQTRQGAPTTSAYAVHTLVRAKNRSVEADQPDTYEYIDNRRMVMTNDGGAISSTDNTYEPVDSPVNSPVDPSAPTEEGEYVDITRRKESGRPRFLSVEKDRNNAPNDRVSVTSYVVFEE